MIAALAAVFCMVQPLPPRVELVRTGSSWELRRGGQKYFVRGAGGSTSLELLKELGGNSIRTWGDGPDIPALLDKAHSLGLTVTVGIWLGHERHGFDYANPQAVAKQLEDARQTIRKYRSHPAVLMWGIGNEMEGFAEGDNPNIWRAVNDVAKMAKAEDPNRPTMTVIAEVGGKKVPSVHNLAPAIDIVGINTYGGASSVLERYKAAGGTKPVILTEFGPIGTWEAPKTDWGVAIEPTSTQKGAMYRTHYQKGVESGPGLALGSYAFIWGWKQEVTATWFGMLLPDGTRLAAAEEMGRLWSGKEPKNKVPVVESFTLKGPATVAPGAKIEVEAKVTDPDGDPMKLEWVLKTEATELGQGGDAEPEQKKLREALISQSATGAIFRAPERQAGYRIFFTVRDGQGGGATANIPINVEDPSRAKAGQKLALPAFIYRSGESAMPWAPSGMMNQPDKITVASTPGAGRTPGGSALRMALNSSAGWGGVAFQHPENDWGDKDGGYDLRGATRLSFWARGERGGEKVKVEYGILGRDKPFFDTSRAELPLVLSRDWKEYSISLAGKDLKRVKTGFVWTTEANGAPVVFYVTDARYE